MTWLYCRKGCGAHRSATSVSVDGEHVPECHVCHDPDYVIPLDADEDDPEYFDVEPNKEV